MKNFLIFGNHPMISLAEFQALFLNKQGVFFGKNVFCTDLNDSYSLNSLIDNLGGTIKIGEVISILDINNQKDVKEIIKKTVIEAAKKTEKKFNFGFSCYSDYNLDLKFGLEVKKELKKININSRLVTSKEKTLSSVIVSQNKLLTNGLEIIIAGNNKEILIGKTKVVQDFKGLSKRDYGRPKRDDYSGMLPPKLARIMINLAGPVDNNLLIMDPFCGSGTIINEALLAGYSKLIAGDISSKAISDSKENALWLKNLYNLSNFDIRYINRSVLNLSKVIKKNSVDIIVTEPYLGPQRGLNNIKAVKEELEALYSQSLNEFINISTKNAKIIMIWPVLDQKIFLEPNISGWKIISPLLKSYLNKKERKSLIYGRQEQRIWREIVILAKKTN